MGVAIGNFPGLEGVPPHVWPEKASAQSKHGPLKPRKWAPKLAEFQSQVRQGDVPSAEKWFRAARGWAAFTRWSQDLGPSAARCFGVGTELSF